MKQIAVDKDDFAINFSVFCAENYSLKFWDSENNRKWFCTKSGKDLTTEELLEIFKNK